MLISRKHRFIFVHVYKNAGTSITAALKPYVLPEWQWFAVRKLKKLGISPWFDPQPIAPHARASQIADHLGLEIFRKFFSFAIVRNPWDWQVSLYTFMLKDTTHPQHDFIKAMGGGNKGFETYIRWRCEHEAMFQCDFVRDSSGRQLVDFVGRFENIEADFAEICRRIGVSVALPRLNVSRSRAYQEYYTDETRELVRRTFAPDIEAFGYDF